MNVIFRPTYMNCLICQLPWATFVNIIPPTSRATNQYTKRNKDQVSWHNKEMIVIQKSIVFILYKMKNVTVNHFCLFSKHTCAHQLFPFRQRSIASDTYSGTANRGSQHSMPSPLFWGHRTRNVGKNTSESESFSHKNWYFGMTGYIVPVFSVESQVTKHPGVL